MMSRNQFWKPVSRPTPSLGPGQPFCRNEPPPLPPKPGGKMYVYVYETPEESNYAASEVHYPQSDECVQFQKSKWKKSARKVYPETSPSINSKGGKMFDKQRKRINNYTKSYSVNDVADYGDGNITYQENTENEVSEYPVFYDIKSRQENVNMPALVNNTIQTKRSPKISGPVIRPLRSPPPEWRAKVEANYELSNSSGNNAPKWERSNSYDTGYQSAPVENTRFYRYLDEERNGPLYYSLATKQERSKSENRPVMFHFNAKRPQNVQRFARSAFVCTPYAYNDFNARPVGWSKAYADNY